MRVYTTVIITKEKSKSNMILTRIQENFECSSGWDIHWCWTCNIPTMGIQRAVLHLKRKQANFYIKALATCIVDTNYGKELVQV